MGSSTDKMWVLILSDDEYIFWVASFAEKEDADAACRLAKANLRDDSGHDFYVSDYPFFVAGTKLDLGKIKALAEDSHLDEDMWKPTDEERIEDLDYDTVETALNAMVAKAEWSGVIRLISRQEFESLPGPRALAISDFALSFMPDVDELPEELSPNWRTPSPGQIAMDGVIE